MMTCPHLSRLDRLDGLSCSACGPDAEAAALRGASVTLRGVLRTIAPTVIVCVALVALGLTTSAIVNI